STSTLLPRRPSRFARTAPPMPPPTIRKSITINVPARAAFSVGSLSHERVAHTSNLRRPPEANEQDSFASGAGSRYTGGLIPSLVIRGEGGPSMRPSTPVFEHPVCTRRTALQAGAVGLLGLGMNHVAALRALAGPDDLVRKHKARCVLYIFLSGGLSQID